MVLNGLYPIDALKSYSEPMRILVQRIPQKKVEEEYFINWKEN